MEALTERQRRVQVIATCLDDVDYEVVLHHADIIGEILKDDRATAQRFLSQMAPVLRQHGIHTPPSLHTWKAVRKELLRRAAERVSDERD